MHGLTGTWKLVRLNLRLDRIKLPVVVLVLSAVFALTVFSVIDVYGGDDLQQIQYAATSAPSIVGRVFAGPIHGPEIGSIVMNEGYLFTALAVAFISTLTVVRHTRQNEETGRSELIGSMTVSRHAPLIAALIVALIANIVIAFVSSAILIVADLPVYGSLVAGAALGATGITFAAFAGIASQLTDGSRGANALCALIIGVAFILRAVGDVLGNLFNNGLGVQSAFPSWISPIGWGQQIYPYAEANSRAWILVIFLITTFIAVTISVILMSKRDIGSGLFATKPGPPRAKKQLLSTFGLASRLQKGILKGWSVAIVVLGITYGFAINEFQGFLEDNEELQEALAQFGGSATDAFLAIMISFMGITITGYVTQAILRMRSEEATGRLESIFGTSVSKPRWMISHLAFVAAGVIVLVILTSLSLGLTYILATGVELSELWPILGATIMQTAAILAFAGYLVALFSFLPNLVVPIAWGSFAACILVLQLGVILNLPQWVLNFSPFGHLPAVPADNFELAPVLGLIVAAVALFTLGFIQFRKRDIKT